MPRAESPSDREQLRRQYGDLLNEVSAALYDADPLAIAAGSNRDEYEPEACTILPRLRTCASQADVQRVVFEEFQRWFGEDLAGEAENYLDPAQRIWRLWCIARPRLTS